MRIPISCNICPSPGAILITRLDHAGDCALSVPPIAHAIKKISPDANIELLTTRTGEMLMRDDPGIDRIIVFDPPWSVPLNGTRRTQKLFYIERSIQFAAQHWRSEMRRYDLILYLSFSPWERILTLPFGKRRAGFVGPYNRRFCRWSNFLLTDGLPFNTNRHMVENCHGLLNSVIPLKHRLLKNQLIISNIRRKHGARKLCSIGFEPGTAIAIHPSNDRSMKSWPSPAPLQLGRRIAAEKGQNVVYVMSPEEYEHLKNDLQRLELEQNRIRHVVTKSFEELAGIAANVKLFIANDGGPMHVAAALGVPTLALFGPTDDRIYGPLSSQSRVLRSRWLCQARHTPWKPDCDCSGKECLKHLSVDEVYGVVCEMLRGEGERGKGKEGRGKGEEVRG